MEDERLVVSNKAKKKGINDKIIFKKKVGKLSCPQKWKSILPVLFKLRNIEIYHPKKVMDILSYISSRNPSIVLTEDEKIELRNYLEKWGYDSSWVF